MNRLKKVLLGLAAVAALAMGGAALAGATSGSSDAAEEPEQGQALSADLQARLEAAALAETGGGMVNEMERDGEKGATYEVEVAKPDGAQVDVRLDDRLGVVAVDADGEHEGND